MKEKEGWFDPVGGCILHDKPDDGLVHVRVQPIREGMEWEGLCLYLEESPPSTDVLVTWLRDHTRGTKGKRIRVVILEDPA